MRRTATCACGQAAIEIDADPTMHGLCHCTNCKRRTGSAFGLSAYVARGAVTATRGETAVYAFHHAAMGHDQQRHFCPRCGTTLYWTLSSAPELVGIAGGCFAPEGLPDPTYEVHEDQRWPWLAPVVPAGGGAPNSPATPDTPEATRVLIERHWALANARDWTGFAALLDPLLRYEVPQTREYCTSAEGYLEMFRTWPGDWRAEIDELVCEAQRAVCVIRFVIGPQVETGISRFAVQGGRITAVTDHWPEPYEPPPRQTPLLLRRPAQA